MVLAGQNAWQSCAGVALLRKLIGKYLPSQLLTQKAGPEPPATRADGTGALCWVPKGSAKKFACGGGAAAETPALPHPEQEVEQALGGGIRHDEHGKDGGSQQRTARQQPKTQLCTQRLLHPTQRDTTSRGNTRLRQGFTISEDGK